MFSTLYLPNFQLQAALHHQSDLLNTRPVALLEAAAHEKDKARVFQLTETAQNHGVHPGMTASQTLARSPHLHLLNRDPDAEQHAQNQLLDIASRFSPDFESTAPGIVTLDLLGNSHLPKYADQLAQKFLAAMRSRGFHDPRVGLAENPGLALLAARLAKQTKIIRAEKHEVQTFLAPLPLSTLNPSPDLTHILSLWGIHTIGDFTQLPLTDTAHRLGPEAVALHEAASGKTSRLLNLVRPPTDFSHRADLEYEIESLDPLLFLFRRALETIAARLSAAWLLAGHLHLRISFQDQTQYQHTFHIPDPTRDVDLLFQILHTHLENFTAPSPVTGFKLETVPTPANGCQFHLFESRLRDPNRFYDTLARLEALLGPDHVGTPKLLPSHRPDAFTLTSFKEEPTSSYQASPPQSAKPGRAWPPDAPASPYNATLPLKRFRPPLPLNIKTNTHTHPIEILSGKFKGRILDHRGPWRHSGDWWDQRYQWAREEWDIHHENQHLYRLTHDTPNHQWLLEGTYSS